MFYIWCWWQMTTDINDETLVWIGLGNIALWDRLIKEKSSGEYHLSLIPEESED